MDTSGVTRRTVLRSTAGAAFAWAGGVPGPAEAAPRAGEAAPPARETLADHAGHVTGDGTLTVTSGTGQRLRLRAYGDGIVRVGAVRPGEEFFPDTRYEMVLPENHAGMVGTLTVADDGDRLTVTTAGIRVVVHKRPLRLQFFELPGGQLLAQEDGGHSLGWESAGNVAGQLFAQPPPDERFVKAGHGSFGRSPRIDRTGDVVAHNYPAGTQQQAPAIVQLYLSSRGYGVFVNTAFDTTFSFAADGVYGFRADNHGSGTAPQLDYFVIAGPEFGQVLDRYTRLTGRPRLPQASIFGLHLSDKNFPTRSDQTWWKQKITDHRGAGFPLDHQVNDNRWREGSGGWSGSWFQFSSRRWPDPTGYAAWAKANGVTVTLDYNRNNSPLMAGWRAGAPPGYSFPSSALGAVANPDAVPDWSSPEARQWLWGVFWARALDPTLGFPGDGLWLDETDELGPIPFDTDTANGWKWAELRNVYLLLLHRGVGAEGWDPAGPGHVGAAKRPWIWSRGACAGQQRFGHYWTGDIESTYDEMRNQIRGMQVAGLGGFPYANIDGGGFRGGPVSDAFYRNWPAAWSSFAPIWRPHCGADTAVAGQRASRWPLDQSVTCQADFRRYGVLRYTMLPYVYTLARVANATGMPMARAMVVDYRQRPRAYTHDLQYLWGPSVLVAPLTSDGGAVQRIWLPAGDVWYDFWTGVKHSGSDDDDLTYPTRTGELPLFVKAGAILPRYPYAQSVAFVDRTRLEMDVYTGRDGSFDLYEDDGVTERYRDGEHSTTTLAYDEGAGRVTVGHPVGTYAGAPAARSYLVRLHGLPAPVGMRVDGGPTLPAFASEAAAHVHGSGTMWDGRVLSVLTRPVGVVTGGGTAAVVEPSGEAFPPVEPGDVRQAEDGRRGGAVVATRHPGYTGTGYVDFADSSATGGYVEWDVPVPAPGPHTLTFRFANGGAVNRPLAVSVDGVVVDGAVAFMPTGGWATWSDTSVRATLPGGTVVVRVATTGANGANLDHLRVTAG